VEDQELKREFAEYNASAVAAGSIDFLKTGAPAAFADD
jgi:hypothetical protein